MHARRGLDRREGAKPWLGFGNEFSAVGWISRAGILHERVQQGPERLWVCERVLGRVQTCLDSWERGWSRDWAVWPSRARIKGPRQWLRRIVSQPGCWCVVVQQSPRRVSKRLELGQEQAGVGFGRLKLERANFFRAEGYCLGQRVWMDKDGSYGSGS